MADFSLNNPEMRTCVPCVSPRLSAFCRCRIFFQTYLPHHKGAPHLTQSLTFYREGQLFQRSAPVELAEFDEDSPDTVTSSVSTPVSSFPKGQYLLQVSTTEAASGASLSEKDSFVVQ